MLARIPGETLSRRAFARLAALAAGASALLARSRDAEASAATGVTAEDVHALRSLPPPAGPTAVRVLGYYAPGDGGGGLFLWSPADTAEPDGGLVLAPLGLAAGALGRWRRTLERAREVELAFFGAVAGGPSAAMPAHPAEHGHHRDGPPRGVGELNYRALRKALHFLWPTGGALLFSGDYAFGWEGWQGIAVGSHETAGHAMAPQGRPRPLHDLELRGTRPGAGLYFTHGVADGAQPQGLKFYGCERLTLEGLTLDGGRPTPAERARRPFGLLRLARDREGRPCRDVTVLRCRLQNAAHTESPFTLGAVGVEGLRLEACDFVNVSGSHLGYLERGQCVRELVVVGCRFGPVPGLRCALYLNVQSGVLSGNVFRNCEGGALNLQASPSEEDTCANVAITGNSIAVEGGRPGFGIRTDLDQGRSIALMRNLTLTGNTLEGCSEPGLGIYTARNVLVAHNILRNCRQHGVLLLGVQELLFTDNTVLAEGRGEYTWGVTVGAFATVEARNVVLAGNVVRGYQGGVAVGATNPAQRREGNALPLSVDGVELRDNHVETAAQQPAQALQVAFFVRRALVRGNVLEGPGAPLLLCSAARVEGNTGSVQPTGVASGDPHTQPVVWYALEGGRKVFGPLAAPPARLPEGLSLAPGDRCLREVPGRGGSYQWVYLGPQGGWREA